MAKNISPLTGGLAGGKNVAATLTELAPIVIICVPVAGPGAGTRDATCMNCSPIPGDSTGQLPDKVKLQRKPAVPGTGVKRVGSKTNDNDIDVISAGGSHSNQTV
jgi:hypothetical protein